MILSFRLYTNLKQKWMNYKSELTYQFYGHINELLEHDMVRQLDGFKQHWGYTRLLHSLDVAYYSYMIARFLHWDARSVARAGLLHDLFLYDWRDGDDGYSDSGRNHACAHPVVALRNAKSICSLNKIEENIIRRHMWLATLVPPRYKEGYIVTFVDKYCAVREVIIGLFNRTGQPVALLNHNA